MQASKAMSIDSGAVAANRQGTDAPPKIHIRGLEKVFRIRGGEVRALGGVNLAIPRGQFCCIVGPSGCGKTTLLRILAGLEEHTGGRVEMYHEDQSRPL